MPERPQAMFAMTAENLPQVFPPDVLTRLRAAVDIAPDLVAEDFTDPRVREALARTESPGTVDCGSRGAWTRRT